MQDGSSPYKAVAVSNAILEKMGLGKVSPMKLQKLLYFAHGWYLAIKGTPLIIENVEAWEYGPVISSVYHEFKKYGAGEISQYYSDYEFDLNGTPPIIVVQPTVPQNDVPTHELIKEVIDVYGSYSAIQLSNLTHLKDTPWMQVREKCSMDFSVAIPNELIKSYFIKVGESNAAAQQKQSSRP